MNIIFREVDPFNCWIWIRFSESPTQDEKNYLDGVFDSWYVLGRLGGFNSENLQTHEEGSDLSWMSYDNEQKNASLPALMHNLGIMEYQNLWGRCWVDFGTSDSISIDILINSLIFFSNIKALKIDPSILPNPSPSNQSPQNPILYFLLNCKDNGMQSQKAVKLSIS